MSVNVSPQCVIVVEAGIAPWTLERFLARVVPSVGDVTVPLLKCFAALSANVEAFLRSLAAEETLMAI